MPIGYVLWVIPKPRERSDVVGVIPSEMAGLEVRMWSDSDRNGGSGTGTVDTRRR